MTGTKKQERTISLKVWNPAKGAGLLTVTVGTDETVYRLVKQSPWKYKISKLEVDTGRESEPYVTDTKARSCTCMGFKWAKSKKKEGEPTPVKSCRHIDGVTALEIKGRI